ncbi:MAG: hypothetical protein ACFFCW_48845 [Candidatus Hodarchaeota archaeon]
MNPYARIIDKFHSAIPVINDWIDRLLESNKENVFHIINLNFRRINQVFPSNLLERAKVVTVESKVPFPPLTQIGLHELSGMEQMPMAGITYKDTFFVNQNCATESLYFHELVHVAQWETLGVDNFLLAYGIGLIQFGYENSPLEQMAYTLQRNFEMGSIPNGIVELIEQQTDAIWNQVTPLLNK